MKVCENSKKSTSKLSEAIKLLDRLMKLSSECACKACSRFLHTALGYQHESSQMIGNLE